jgi:peptidoglycan/LPS O-acetylase OafA/YrhL
LDFTKGVLVLLMLLYHWINYFVTAYGDFYRYLRFITPSFIFITGFLITHIYLAKYQIADPRLQKRLIQRGGKLLVVFTLLNIAALFMVRRVDGSVSRFDLFLDNLGAIYLGSSGKAAAFMVLAPISYILILSPLLLLLLKVHRFALHVVCGVLFLCIYALGQQGIPTGSLELFTMGVLGMVVGLLPAATMERAATRPVWIALAYLVYLVAITGWRESFPIQILGVCVNLWLIYFVGMKLKQRLCEPVPSRIVLLGNYSLLAYIVQIAILIALSALFAKLGLGRAGVLVVSAVAASALTWLVVEIADFARRRSRAANWCYNLVFA